MITANDFIIDNPTTTVPDRGYRQEASAVPDRRTSRRGGHHDRRDAADQSRAQLAGRTHPGPRRLADARLLRAEGAAHRRWPGGRRGMLARRPVLAYLPGL